MINYSVFIAAFISPFQKDRAFARELHQVADLKFYEIYVDTPLEVCKERDTKGLYARAERGEIKGLTGIDAPYQVPENPEIRLKTVDETIEETGLQVIQYLVDSGVIKQEVLQESSSDGEEEEEQEDIQVNISQSKPKTKKKKVKNKKKKDRR